jgi:hypothetical protein
MNRTTYPVLILAFVLTALSTTRPSLAGRACIDNFVETGDRNSGKSFKSFVEISGDPAKVFQSVGQKIATEGFAGLSASKDLRVVSAYQDTNGKHSPVNATITEPQPGHVRIEVVFQLAPGLTSPTSAVKDELCTILEAAMPAGERAAEAAQTTIALKTASGDAALSMMAGSVRKSGVFPVLKIYSDIEGAHSTVRTKETRPVLVVREPVDPSKKYLLVFLEPDENRRALKMMSGAKLVKTAFTGKVDYAPDADWTVPFTVQQEAPGVWKIMPGTDLKPGEYGLWDLEGMALAPFGVDS